MSSQASGSNHGDELPNRICADKTLNSIKGTVQFHCEGFTVRAATRGRTSRTEYYKYQYAHHTGGMQAFLWVERDVDADTVTMTRYNRRRQSSFVILKITGLTSDKPKVFDGDNVSLGHINDSSIYDKRSDEAELKIHIIHPGMYQIDGKKKTVNAGYVALFKSMNKSTNCYQSFNITFAERQAVSPLNMIWILALTFKFAIRDLIIDRMLYEIRDSPLPGAPRYGDQCDRKSVGFRLHPKPGVDLCITQPLPISGDCSCDFPATPQTVITTPTNAESMRISTNRTYTIKPIGTSYYPRTDFLLVEDCINQIPAYVIEVKRNHAYARDLMKLDNIIYECSNVRDPAVSSFVKHNMISPNRLHAFTISVKDLEIVQARPYASGLKIMLQPQEDKFNVMYTVQRPDNSGLLGYCIARDARKLTTVVLAKDGTHQDIIMMLFTAMKLLTYAITPATDPLSSKTIKDGEQLLSYVRRMITAHNINITLPDKFSNLSSIAPATELANLISVTKLALIKSAIGRKRNYDYYTVIDCSAESYPLLVAKVDRDNAGISMYDATSLVLLYKMTDYDDKLVFDDNVTENSRSYGSVVKEHKVIHDDDGMEMAQMKEQAGKSLLKISKRVQSISTNIANVEERQTGRSVNILLNEDINVRLKAMIIGFGIHKAIEMGKIEDSRVQNVNTLQEIDLNRYKRLNLLI